MAVRSAQIEAKLLELTFTHGGGISQSIVEVTSTVRQAVADATNSEVVDALLRLASANAIVLTKWNRDTWAPYDQEWPIGDFFYRDDFRLAKTERSQPYHEVLQERLGQDRSSSLGDEHAAAAEAIPLDASTSSGSPSWWSRLQPWQQLLAAIVGGACLIIAAIIARLPLPTSAPPEHILTGRDSGTGSAPLPGSTSSPSRTAYPESPSPQGSELPRNTTPLEDLVGGSEFARREKIKQDLQRFVERIDQQADARQRNEFPDISRSIEATGDSATQEKFPAFGDFDDYIWSYGIRAIVHANHNDLPYAESIFYFGRRLDESEDIVLARLYRGQGDYESKEVLRAPAEDNSISSTVIAEAKRELKRLEPIYAKLLNESGPATP